MWYDNEKIKEEVNDMFRKTVFGVLAVAAAAAAVVAVRYVANKRKDAQEEGLDEGDEVRFIEINEEEEDEESDDDPDGRKPSEVHVDSIHLDEEETEDDVADLQQDKADEDEDVLEISSLYPYLSTSFIAQTLSRNEEFNTNFPEDTLVSVLHTCQFDDMRSLLNFEAIMADAGYISQHDDNLEVRSAKRFFSEEGAIISDILNVANQAAALDGRYIDCELN